MPYENDKQACACGGDCDCNDVEEAVQEEQPVVTEETESTPHSCGCGGCGCH